MWWWWKKQSWWKAMRAQKMMIEERLIIWAIMFMVLQQPLPISETLTCREQWRMEKWRWETNCSFFFLRCDIVHLKHQKGISPPLGNRFIWFCPFHLICLNWVVSVTNWRRNVTRREEFMQRCIYLIHIYVLKLKPTKKVLRIKYKRKKTVQDGCQQEEERKCYHMG